LETSTFAVNPLAVLNSELIKQQQKVTSSPIVQPQEITPVSPNPRTVLSHPEFIQKEFNSNSSIDDWIDSSICDEQMRKSEFNSLQSNGTLILPNHHGNIFGMDMDMDIDMQRSSSPGFCHLASPALSACSMDFITRSPSAFSNDSFFDHCAISDDIFPFQSVDPTPQPTSLFGGMTLLEGIKNGGIKQRRKIGGGSSLLHGPQSPLRPKLIGDDESSSFSDSEIQIQTYTCTFNSCGKKFRRYENLRRHLRCHSGERPYVCPIEGCSKTFARSDILSQHIRHHQNLLPKPMVPNSTTSSSPVSPGTMTPFSATDPSSPLVPSAIHSPHLAHLNSPIILPSNTVCHPITSPSSSSLSPLSPSVSLSSLTLQSSIGELIKPFVTC